MASLGRAEEKALKQNVIFQIQRLKMQLQDLERFKGGMEEAEYAETKTDTEAQLEEFQECLRGLTSGSMTLVDSFGVSRLAMRKAIRAAFATPEVRKMFEQQNTRALRVRLEQLQSDRRLNKIDADSFKDQVVEVMVALKNLGAKLTDKEKAFLDSSRELMAKFESADKAIGASKLISMAQPSK